MEELRFTEEVQLVLPLIVNGNARNMLAAIFLLIQMVMDIAAFILLLIQLHLVFAHLAQNSVQCNLLSERIDPYY